MVDTLRTAMQRLGVHPDRERALLALPFAYIARAGNAPSAFEERRVQVLAAKAVGGTATDAKTVDAWLHAPLGAGYFRDGLRTLRALATMPDAPAIEVDDLLWVAAECEALVRDAAEANGLARIAHKLDALGTVNALLGVDLGLTWTELLTSLGAGPPSGPGIDSPCPPASGPSVVHARDGSGLSRAREG